VVCQEAAQQKSSGRLACRATLARTKVHHPPGSLG
jgi:hypothetical protein